MVIRGYETEGREGIVNLRFKQSVKNAYFMDINENILNSYKHISYKKGNIEFAINANSIFTICIGILVADVIVKPADTLPEEGKLELVDKLELYTGGCAVNAAIDMSKIGIDVAIIGKVGSDGFGKFMKTSLQNVGVSVDGLVEDSDSSTSASVVLINSAGERSFMHSIGANAKFTASDVDLDIIRDSKIVFIAGTILMPNFDGRPCTDF